MLGADRPAFAAGGCATNSRMMFALSIAGLHNAPGPGRGGSRALIEWAAAIGYRAIALDAAAPDVRARALGRSARRDLAATIRRCGLAPAGLDLWIPPEHFASPATEDRAASALLDAIGLASELVPLARGAPGAGGGRAVVSVTLPDDPPASLIDAVAAAADAGGVVVEDYTADAPAAGGLIRPGFDTARCIMRGAKPGKPFAKLASDLATLRLNDADDTGRRALGGGRLDVEMMRALHATLTPTIPVVTDLRGLHDPAAGADAALRAWGDT